VALNVFIIAGMARTVPIADIFRGITPFLVAMLVLLILLTAWPNMALMLPRTMK
jgi:TRAP-type C4-dicarboxylate transport system permease large subunit